MLIARLLILIAVFLLSASLSRAAVPELNALHPVGGPLGTTNVVTAFGAVDPWPPKVWINKAGVEFTATTNKGKFEAVLAATAEPGPRLVRFYNDQGASEPRFFIVGPGPEVVETEPNDYPDNAQKWTAPVVVNGRLDKRDDVDSFRITLTAGQVLEAHVESHTLMSKVDAVLRLLDSRGQQLIWNHDHATFDPRLTWAATNEQDVVVQIFGFPYPADSEVRFTGGDGAFYRLHLNATNSVSPQSAQESSDSPAKLPYTIKGCISSGTEEDRVQISVAKGQTIEATVHAATSGSPLDAWLKVIDENGKEIARNDDAQAADPRVEWTAADDEILNLVVGSVTHRGGPDYRYQLTARTVAPEFAVMFGAGSAVLKSGETNNVEVKFKRLRGHTNDVEIAFTDLPAGVTGGSTNLPVKGDSFSIPLTASGDAVAFQGPIQLVATEEGKEPQLALFELVTKSENNGVPGGYQTLAIPSLDHLWLTVRPAETNLTNK